MNVLVVTPPERLVSLDDMKAHLRVTTDDEDDLIGAYIDAAGSWLDGPHGWLGQCIGPQVLEVRYGNGRGLTDWAFRSALTPPMGPLLSVVEVEYWDREGVAQPLDVEGLYVEDGQVQGYAGAAWVLGANRVRLRYRAGFDPVPKSICQAVKLLVGQWFRNRSAINVGNIVNELPNGVKALLGPYWIRRI
ncbi:MAG: phage gp6-like head-tail connector protein [Brevundimonas sp.]|nr:MAG: phage gp6-like head-tail connector protein [Brevundimonas sp.]